MRPVLLPGTGKAVGGAAALTRIGDHRILGCQKCESGIAKRFIMDHNQS